MYVCVFQHFLVLVTATIEIYPLSLHDALPILGREGERGCLLQPRAADSRQPGAHGSMHLRRLRLLERDVRRQDRKSTRLNSSHLVISYAVFCLKKKKTRINIQANDATLNNKQK